MQAHEDDGIPADLARQLEAIERSVNVVPPHVLVEAVFDLPPVPRRGRVNTPALHRLRTDAQSARRKSARLRSACVYALVVGLCLSVVGTVLLKADLVSAGMLALVLGGGIIGWAAVTSYLANLRVQRAEAELERFDDAQPT